MSEELKPCPFCGSEIKHIVSIARSFVVPREYHEYHHPQSDDCFLARKRWGFSDDLAPRDEFITKWNRRADSTIRARTVEECARVADAYVGKQGSVYSRHAGRGVANAIRKLSAS